MVSKRFSFFFLQSFKQKHAKTKKCENEMKNTESRKMQDRWDIVPAAAAALRDLVVSHQCSADNTLIETKKAKN